MKNEDVRIKTALFSGNGGITLTTESLPRAKSVIDVAPQITQSIDVHRCTPSCEIPTVVFQWTCWNIVPSSMIGTNAE